MCWLCYVAADLHAKLNAVTLALFDVSSSQNKRVSLLRGALVVSERFHSDFTGVSESLKDIKRTLVDSESPGVDENVVKSQQQKLLVSALTSDFYIVFV